MYNEIQTSPAPSQRKFNGDYGFSFNATAGEVDAGSVIVRKNLVGVSHRNTEIGDYGVAELQGTVTVNKAAATVFDQGDDVFWNTTTKLAVKVGGAGTVRLGICKLTPSTNSETVEVLTNAIANAVSTTEVP